MTLVDNTPLKDAFSGYSIFNNRLVWKERHAVDYSNPKDLDSVIVPSYNVGPIELANDDYYFTVIDTIARWKWYGILDIRYPRGK